MSQPLRQMNTFVKDSNTVNIDAASRNFILLQVICGLCRLPVLGVKNKCLLALMFGLTITYNVTMFYFVYNTVAFSLYKFALIFDVIEFVACTMLGFMLSGRLLIFYIEINKIDNDLGFKCTGHMKEQSLIIFLQVFIIGLTFVILLSIFPRMKNIYIRMLYLLPLKLLHYVELNYYGHLFGIIALRLKFFKDITKQSCNKNTAIGKGIFKTHHVKLSTLDIVSLTDAYSRFLKAYEYLNKAIKWQMLITLISIFFVSLSLSYHIVKLYLGGKEETYWKPRFCVTLSFLLIEVVPFIVPCVLANQICYEIVYLKEIITPSLFENKIDKRSRGTARLFLELLQTHPLSFPLLHLFELDIVLPFKLMGLVLTYLLILLQFDKVINLYKVI